MEKEKIKHLKELKKTMRKSIKKRDKEAFETMNKAFLNNPYLYGEKM